jgi:hypothetical protein
MSKIFFKAMIEDVRAEKCNDAEVEALLEVFEYSVKRMARMLARKAWFELADYSNASQSGIDRFTLMLERRMINGTEQWWGNFEYGGKKLKVIGTLECVSSGSSQETIHQD